MTKSPTPEERLFDVASAQQGYFTTQQAVSAGYQMNHHPYHVKQGHWTREYRDIYHLSNFPSAPADGQQPLFHHNPSDNPPNNG